MPKYTYEYTTARIHQDWMPFFEENNVEIRRILKIIDDISIANIVYPRPKDVFRAFYYHGPKDIKLTWIAQDCYIKQEHGVPQAMGLCFSVPRKHKKIPPSLGNIFTEIKNCYPEFNKPRHGLLKKWARKEKILMLNSSLTVIHGISNSHAYLWNNITDKIIQWFYNINKEEQCPSLYLLMGNYAKKKGDFIDDKSKVFITVHPSPLSAYNGFFGSGVFKNINTYLEENNIKPIKW